MKILGVEVQLIFPAGNPASLDEQQIEQLKKSMHDSLEQAIRGRMLEELGKYDDFFTESLHTTLVSILNQWHLQPKSIKLERLVVH